MPFSAASPLRSAKRTRRVARISMAVPQVSQSPWAKWASPAENRAPGVSTGMSSRAPLPSCLMSTLPACLAGRDRAQRLAGDARVGRHRGRRRRRQHEAAAVEQRLLARRGPGEQLVSRREADGAHERRAGDADAGQVGRGRPTVGDVPVDHERVGEHVAQEAEPRHLDGVAVAVGFDVKDLDLEQVAGLGAL